MILRQAQHSVNPIKNNKYADMPEGTDIKSLLRYIRKNTQYADMPEWSNGLDLGSNGFCLHRFDPCYPHDSKWITEGKLPCYPHFSLEKNNEGEQILEQRISVIRISIYYTNI